jgi:hypothetical protein
VKHTRQSVRTVGLTKNTNTVASAVDGLAENADAQRSEVCTLNTERAGALRGVSGIRCSRNTGNTNALWGHCAAENRCRVISINRIERAVGGIHGKSVVVRNATLQLHALLVIDGENLRDESSVSVCQAKIEHVSCRAGRATTVLNTNASVVFGSEDCVDTGAIARGSGVLAKNADALRAEVVSFECD